MPTLSASRGATHIVHRLERAFVELLANARAVSETYVRIAYDRPWDPPASKRAAACSR